ncbi:GM13222 [Drosophila sechellia]|uniref:GM13222 n=1 Tax=Drosophila sechellia TaxID=7238 RepID=B4ILB6_DROSE|nr:GM13222 [Drosophila sechellia]
MSQDAYFLVRQPPVMSSGLITITATTTTTTTTTTCKTILVLLRFTLGNRTYTFLMLCFLALRLGVPVSRRHGPQLPIVLCPLSFVPSYVLVLHLCCSNRSAGVLPVLIPFPLAPFRSAAFPTAPVV